MNESRKSHAAVAGLLDARDAQYAEELRRIGNVIGYGNAQAILGRLWDEMLEGEYGVSGRGTMGVTVDDALPPIPKAASLRRQMQPNGGYRMVPAYSVAELKAFAHAAIATATIRESRTVADQPTDSEGGEA